MRNEHPPDLSLFLGTDPALSAGFDQAYVDAQASTLGEDVVGIWEAIKEAALAEAERGQGQ